MQRPNPLILMIAFGIGIAQAGDTQIDELQKQFGGPYTDIPTASQTHVINYVEAWIAGFSSLESTTPISAASFEETYKSKLHPLIEPLREGTASEKKVYAAAEEIFRALNYIKSNKGDWNDEKLNRLLAIDAKTTDNPAKIAEGISGLFSAFIHLAAPAKSAEFDKKYRIKEISK